MGNDKVVSLAAPAEVSDPLTDLLRSGISAHTISKYEKGIAKPGSKALAALASALNVPADFLLAADDIDSKSASHYCSGGSDTRGSRCRQGGRMPTGGEPDGPVVTFM